MRPVNLPNPRIQDTRELTEVVADAFRELEDASRVLNLTEIAQNYTLSNVTETRSLDPTAATAQDVANVFATFLQDLQKGGALRS